MSKKEEINSDIAHHTNLEQFSKPVSDKEYNEIIELIKSKLCRMEQVNALIEVRIAPNQAPIVIDARKTPAVILPTSNEKPETVITISPLTLKKLSKGQIETRFAMFWGGLMMTDGNTRPATKFGDSMCPVIPTHPAKVQDKSKLPKPTRDIEQVRRDIEEFGYGLVADALSPEQLKTLKNRIREQADGEKEAGVGEFDGGVNSPNQRIFNLANKGDEFLDLLDNPLIDSLIPDFLGDGAIIFSYTANIARPGNTPMPIHTDQGSIQPPIRDIPLGLNTMFFLEDVTESNGGTRVFPGSHKGNVAPDDLFDITDTVAAEGKAGTALVFESRLWHTTGPNTESKGERPVIILFFVRAFLRQQENMFLSLSPEVLDKLSDRHKAFIGYRVTGSLGAVGGRAPEGTIVSRPEKSIGEIRAGVKV